MYHIPGTPLAETLSGFLVGDWAMAKFLVVLVAALMAWGSTAQAEEHGRWQELENNPSCSVWNAYPQSNETVTWSGACVNGKAEGDGREVWRHLEDGEWKEDVYEGELKDGKWHGHGVYEWADGGRYEGDWKDGMKHGRGVYVWASGARYEGEFRDGKFNGRGLFVFANGNRYEGNNRGGKKDGRGVFVFANGDKCEGDWREGKLLGMGVAMLWSGQWREYWACWGLRW